MGVRKKEKEERQQGRSGKRKMGKLERGRGKVELKKENVKVKQYKIFIDSKAPNQPPICWKLHKSRHGCHPIVRKLHCDRRSARINSIKLVYVWWKRSIARIGATVKSHSYRGWSSGFSIQSPFKVKANVTVLSSSET